MNLEEKVAAAEAERDRQDKRANMFEAEHLAACERIDNLSRELTAEIEAHRVTRERANAAENALHCLIEEVRHWAHDPKAPSVDALVELLAKYRKGGGS